MSFDNGTLTTLTSDHLVCDNKFTNDVDTVCPQNSKTVECRLGMTYKKIAETEGNIYLFKTLKTLGLATNDVHNFIRKQVLHKRAYAQIDYKLQKSAMHSKLGDAIAYASRLRRQRDYLKRKVSVKFRDNKSKCRRLLDRMVVQYKIHKADEIDDARAKIDHYLTRLINPKSLQFYPVNNTWNPD